MTSPNLLDTVAILSNIPANRLQLVEPDYASLPHLPQGLIGTIIEVYQQENIPHYLVEFADKHGREYAMAVLQAREFLVLNAELPFDLAS